MNKASVRHKDIRLIDSADSNGSAGKSISTGKTKFLEHLAFTLLREVQSLSEIPVLDLEEGIDLYEEVSRFEKSIIERVLLHTGCHQIRAARLLKLKPTTLNSKIKNYRINLNELMSRHSAMFQPNGMDRSQDEGV
ncbi:MAG TPA: helix-turn-helix domain-containing protein [Pyrinomonadaceae bacterium]|nr:helix-turn-helix domain-containing protein [Pyrinomonadaceae bacterium]